jgi:hypothetical protein
VRYTQWSSESLAWSTPCLRRLALQFLPHPGCFNSNLICAEALSLFGVIDFNGSHGRVIAGGIFRPPRSILQAIYNKSIHLCSIIYLVLRRFDEPRGGLAGELSCGRSCGFGGYLRCGCKPFFCSSNVRHSVGGILEYLSQLKNQSTFLVIAAWMPSPAIHSALDP